MLNVNYFCESYAIQQSLFFQKNMVIQSSKTLQHVGIAKNKDFNPANPSISPNIPPSAACEAYGFQINESSCTSFCSHDTTLRLDTAWGTVEPWGLGFGDFHGEPTKRLGDSWDYAVIGPISLTWSINMSSSNHPFKKSTHSQISDQGTWPNG